MAIDACDKVRKAWGAICVSPLSRQCKSMMHNHNKSITDTFSFKIGFCVNVYIKRFEDILRSGGKVVRGCPYISIYFGVYNYVILWLCKRDYYSNATTKLITWEYRFSVHNK